MPRQIHPTAIIESGAELGEDAGAEGTGDQRTEFEYADAFERALWGHGG